MVRRAHRACEDWTYAEAVRESYLWHIQINPCTWFGQIHGCVRAVGPEPLIWGPVLAQKSSFHGTTPSYSRIFQIFQCRNFPWAYTDLILPLDPNFILVMGPWYGAKAYTYTYTLYHTVTSSRTDLVFIFRALGNFSGKK